MAIVGYEPVTLAPGECFDAEGHVKPLLNNLQVLYDNAQSTRQNLFCQPVLCSLTTSQDDELACCEIQPDQVDTSPQSADSQIDDKRIFMLDLSGAANVVVSDSDSDGSDAGETNAVGQIRFEIYCQKGDDPEELLYTTAWGMPRRVVEFEAVCPRTAVIKLCMRGRIQPGTLTGQSVQAVNGNARICGGILSVREGGTNTFTSTKFFCAGEFDPDCRHGKEALYLINQNANTLCQTYVDNCDQTVDTTTAEGDGTDEIVLQGAIQAKTTWIARGEITVCYRSLSTDLDSYVSIKPRIGCPSNIIDCGTNTYQVPRIATEGDFQGPIICKKIPVVACGTCNETEDLLYRASSQIECRGTATLYASEGIYTEILSIESEFCVYLIEKTENEALPAQTKIRLWDCNPYSVFQNLLTKIDQLHTFACNREPINCQTLDGPTSYAGDQTDEIQPATPWPPAAPLPRPVPDPPPIKEFSMNISACVRALRRPSLWTETQVYARGRFEVLCGGAVVGETDSVQWLMHQKEGDDGERDQVDEEFGGCVSFKGCIQCPIDQPISIRFIGETSQYTNIGWAPDPFIGSTSANVFGLCL